MASVEALLSEAPWDDMEDETARGGMVKEI